MERLSTTPSISTLSLPGHDSHTLGQAPALAATLQDQAGAIPKEITHALEEVPEWERQVPTPTLGKHSSSTIWYEDSKLKRRHRELVKAGMERARKLGKRIGRPKVTERDGFAERFAEVVSRIGPDGLSPRQAARELDISLSTLRRLSDLDKPPAVPRDRRDLRSYLSANGRYMPETEDTDIIAQR